MNEKIEPMKKKVLLIGAMAIALLTSYEVISLKKEKTSSLVLENIEALAFGEWDNNVHCFGVGSVDCPITHTKVESYISGLSLD